MLQKEAFMKMAAMKITLNKAANLLRKITFDQVKSGPIISSHEKGFRL